MNRPNPSHLMAGLLGATVLGLAAFTASAQAVGTASLDPDAQVQVVTDTVDARSDAVAPTAAQVDLAAQRDADRNCLRYTGTRIVARSRPARDCVAQHGNVYTRDDLDRTGEVDMARALRKLDTSAGW